MPLQIQVTSFGITVSVAKLIAIVRGADVAMQQGAEDSLNYIFDSVPGYPGAPPNSRYSRTGRLGGSVKAFAGDTEGALSKVTPQGRGVEAFWGTAVSYADYVIGYQAWMHKGRWWTMRGVWGRARGGVAAIWRGVVAKLIRGDI